MKRIKKMLGVIAAAMALAAGAADEVRPLQVEYGKGGCPSDAIALFDGTNLDRWRCISGGKATWPIQADGTMRVDKTGNNPDEESRVSICTKDAFGDFQLHLEFRIPESCRAMKHPQWRGNSGVIVFGCYEIQILGSKGQETYANGLAGSVYGVKAPDVLASKDFGAWEAYDIVFHAPVVEKGAAVRPATLTVLQNGVLVQDHAEVLPFPDTPENRVRTRGEIQLQSHNDDSEPVSFRNIWLRRLASQSGRAALSVDLPSDASATQRYAANELCAYIARITGEDPVRNGTAERRIRLVTEESAKLGADGFRLTSKDGVTEIRGSARRGCLYGAYALLERFGGVRFYSSWCEKVPRAEAFVVPDGMDVAETPDFEMRQPFWGDIIKNRAFGAKLRVNGYNHTKNDIADELGGDDYRFGGGLPSCHTFLRLCPTGTYFGTHPEYFSLVKGKRQRKYTQLCLTNPDVLEIVTSNVLERIRKDPGAKFYGVSQEDWDNWCECPACKAVDDEEGSHAGTVVRFVNAVAERVEKAYPDVLIETLAYRYSRKPPKKTRLRRNVVPCLCTIECDFARSLDKSPYEQNKAFLNDIVGWSAQTDRLYVWDYVTQFANYPQPFPNVYALQDNVRFFRDHGVKMLFEQGAYEGYHAGFAELKAWLLAKWLWDADLEMKPLLDDFFDGYYGKAAPFVRAYFEKLHAKQLEISSDPKRPLTLYMPVNVPPYTDEAFMSEADRLWERATDAVRGDEVRAYNVRMGRFSHRYARLEMLRHKLGTLEKMRADPALVALTKEMLADIDAARGPVLLREHAGRSEEQLKAWRAIVE